MPRYPEADPNVGSPMIIFKEVEEVKVYDEAEYEEDPTENRSSDEDRSSDEEERESKRLKLDL